MASYSLKELARASNVKPRAIRSYIQNGILAPPRLQGSNTRYGEDYLYALLAIQKLKAGGYGLDLLRQRIQSATPAELRILAEHGRAPSTYARAETTAGAPLRVPSPDEPLTPTTESFALRPGAVGRYRDGAERAHGAWERIVLCPGVELHVQVGADVESRRVAREIAALYG